MIDNTINDTMFAGVNIMIKINIDNLLQEKNKSMYWLAKETDISYNNLLNLIKGKNKSISFEVLEKICLALECDISDILEIID